MVLGAWCLVPLKLGRLMLLMLKGSLALLLPFFALKCQGHMQLREGFYALQHGCFGHGVPVMQRQLRRFVQSVTNTVFKPRLDGTKQLIPIFRRDVGVIFLLDRIRCGVWFRVWLGCGYRSMHGLKVTLDAKQIK